jgi:hypothetical protein
MLEDDKGKPDKPDRIDLTRELKKFSEEQERREREREREAALERERLRREAEGRRKK